MPRNDMDAMLCCTDAVLCHPTHRVTIHVQCFRALPWMAVKITFPWHFPEQSRGTNFHFSFTYGVVVLYESEDIMMKYVSMQLTHYTKNAPHEHITQSRVSACYNHARFVPMGVVATYRHRHCTIYIVCSTHNWTSVSCACAYIRIVYNTQILLKSMWFFSLRGFNSPI